MVPDMNRRQHPVHFENAQIPRLIPRGFDSAFWGGPKDLYFMKLRFLRSRKALCALKHGSVDLTLSWRGQPCFSRSGLCSPCTTFPTSIFSYLNQPFSLESLFDLSLLSCGFSSHWGISDVFLADIATCEGTCHAQRTAPWRAEWQGGFPEINYKANPIFAKTRCCI